MSAKPLKIVLAYHYALISIIPFLMIVLVCILVVYPHEKVEIEHRHQETAYAIDEKIASFLNSQITEITSVSSRQLHEKNIQEILDEAVVKSASLNALYLLSTAGVIQKVGLHFAHADKIHRDLELVDMSQTGIFKKVATAKKPVWSDIFLSVVTGGQAIAYAIPKGNGYLIGEVSLDEISNYLQRISPSPEELILVADQKGQIIADKNSHYRSRQLNISNIELMKSLSAHKHPLTGGFLLDDIEYIATASEIGSLGWRSLLATQKESAFAEAFKTIKIVLSGLLSALLLAAISSKLLIRKITHQLERLERQTREIAGNGVKPEWFQGEIIEFNQVVDSLHRMADILNQREGAILEGLNHIRFDKIRFECLYDLSSMESFSEQEILDYALEAAVKVTDSTIGYVYSLNDAETVLTLHAWSKDVMAQCSIPSPLDQYQVADIGHCVEAVRQRRPVITNNYAAPHPAKRGCPEGHVPIQSHLNLPIFYQGKIVLLVGVGNKKAEYDDDDIHQLNLLLDAAWLLIQKKRGELLLKESEERSRQMFEQNDDALLFFKLPTMRPLDANSTAFRLLGHEQHDLQHLSVRHIFGRTGIKRLFAAIRSEKSDFIIDRLKCYRRDGPMLVVSARGRVLSLKNEKVLLCSLRDMTAKIQLEEEMKATQAKLIQANKMSSLGLLVSSIAHEINNPNQSIGMNAFIMGRVWRDTSTLLCRCHGDDESFLIDGVTFGEMKETVPQMLDAINQGSRRIDNYIQRLMGFVKDGKGSLDSIVDVNSAVENAVSILWYQIRSNTDNFSKVLAAEKPQILGNIHQIEQVIINLIANAIQSLSSPANAVMVTTAISADGSSVIITVQDEGRGMNRATIERIAEPFFSTRQNDGGTGLGVYITSNIIKDHCGTIEYDSAPDAGTTVTIRLPALAVNNQESLLHE